MKKFILLLSVLFLLSIHSNAYMVLNGIVRVFSEPEKTVINTLLVDGAADFLSSYSAALSLISEFERSANGAFDFDDGMEKIKSALLKLRSSREKFAEALTISEKSIYNERYRSKLAVLDYDGFSVSTKYNNKPMSEVSTFLKMGDILGLYKQNLQNVDQVIIISEEIQEALKNYKQPDVTSWWSLLQQYSHCMLFGNYAAVLAKEAFKE